MCTGPETIPDPTARALAVQLLLDIADRLAADTATPRHLIRIGPTDLAPQPEPRQP